MPTTDEPLSEYERMNLVERLDMTAVITTLTHPARRLPQLTRAQAEKAIGLYRYFLMLHFLEPTMTLVPTPLIEAVWQAHILNTAKYRNDCQAIFGHHLDHTPHAEVSPQERRRTRHMNLTATRDAFERHFRTELKATDIAPARGSWPQPVWELWQFLGKLRVAR